MQPRLGQLPGQGGPSGLSVMWPSSAPRPCAPRKVIPSITTPPPTPVPSVSITRWSSPSMWASASAAQFASLSTNTGTPKRRPSSSRSGTPVSGMLTLVSTVPVAYSIWDGTPTPIASGWPTRSIMRFTAVSIPSSSASVVCVTVGSCVASRTVTPSTAATATFVPPTSTPRTTIGIPIPARPNKQAPSPGIHRRLDVREPGGHGDLWARMGHMSPPRRRLVGGLDLGGTKIQAVVLDGRRSVIGEAKSATPTTEGAQDVILALVSTMGSACADAGVELGDLAGVGVGSPGAIDSRRGVVTGARNLPGEGAPIKVAAGFRTLADTRAYVDNDVTVGVNAEYHLGAARRSKSLLGVWWGTGVGGGIVLHGEPWDGRGAAAELGHVVVKIGGAECTCGRRGCMEAYAGRGSMEIRARREHKKGRKTDLFKIMEKRGRTRLTSGVWARALEGGDELAIELVDRALEALGAGVASAVNLLDCETVVIGGGLGTRLGEPYVERIREAMQPHLFVDDRPPRVALAELGDLGGAIGAALLVPPGSPGRKR